MSENNVDSAYTLDKSSNLEVDKYLTNDEKRLLSKLNKTANKLSKQKNVKLFDKSLNSMLNEWSKTMANIFHDFSNVIYINKYIKISNNLYEFIVNISRDIWEILTNGERIIYVGFTFIFISLVVYFINVAD
jgi:hypothetical protein